MHRGLINHQTMKNSTGPSTDPGNHMIWSKKNSPETGVFDLPNIYEIIWYCDQRDQHYMTYLIKYLMVNSVERFLWINQNSFYSRDHYLWLEGSVLEPVWRCGFSLSILWASGKLPKSTMILLRSLISFVKTLGKFCKKLPGWFWELCRSRRC